jgi:hypothetical protein
MRAHHGCNASASRSTLRLELFVAGALMCAVASPAMGQSAEETALLIATGVEIGATTRNKASEPLQRYEKIGDNPLTLRGIRIQNSPGLSDSRVKVERSGPCKYIIVTTWEQNHQGKQYMFRGATSVDLTDAGPAAFVRPYPDAKPRGPIGTLEFPGARITAEISRDGAPVPTPRSLVYYGTQERLDQAVAHMRTTYCPGRPN